MTELAEPRTITCAECGCPMGTPARYAEGVSSKTYGVCECECHPVPLRDIEDWPLP